MSKSITFKGTRCRPWLVAAATALLAAGAARAADETDAPNGINVFQPKIYDDRTLQQLLRSLSGRLSSLTGIDQAGLSQRIGTLQGATSSQIGGSLSATMTPTPGIVTTALTGTPSLQTTNSLQTVSAPTGVTTTALNQTVGNQAANTMQTVTTAPQVTPGASALPAAGSPALPTAYGISSVDALNEQLQLSSAIIGLQLLLQGPLDDEYTPKGAGRNHVTLGFPISIETPPRYRKAVAEVEVSVCNGPGVLEQIDPNLQNILPQEKTYNVASLSSRAFGLGAGAVVSNVVNLGGNFLWNRQTYYLVRDQDTVAVRRQGGVTRQVPCPGGTAPVTFGWQFRPVLNRATVQQGMRQTFAQVSLAPFDLTKGPPTVQVIAMSCWRRYDAKTGIVGNPIAGSCHWMTRAPNPQVIFDTTAFDAITLTDRSDGYVSTRVAGRYLPGTQVAIGDAYLGEGTPGFENNGKFLSFTASAQAVALRGARLVSPDGSQNDLKSALPAKVRQCWEDQRAYSADSANDAKLSTYNDSQVEIRVPLRGCLEPEWLRYLKNHPPIIVLNGRAFGLDSPFRYPTQRAAIFLAPKSLLQGGFRLDLQLLYSQAEPIHLPGSPWDSATITGVVLISSTSSDTTYAITGSKLKKEELKILSPAGVTLRFSDDPIFGDHTKFGDRSTLATFTLTADQLKATKQVILLPRLGAPILVSLPDGGPAKEAKAKLAPHAAVPSGSAASFTIAGSGLNQVSIIGYLGRPLPFVVAEDGKSLTLPRLPGDAVSTPGVVRLQVTLSDGTTQDYAITVGP